MLVVTDTSIPQEILQVTRYRALLGCAAIAVMVALGFPSLTARASDGTEPIAEPAATGDATSDQQTGEPS